jgi:hypothetical protein
MLELIDLALQIELQRRGDLGEHVLFAVPAVMGFERPDR